MKVVGLVVEYNPLHNGHLYHYQQAVQSTGAEATVAVMSGNFLQRGEPAITDKWARAEMALAIGIDLVLELPVAYCTQNAETFAFGAVSTLHSLGVVDGLCFGSESGDIRWIHSLAEHLSHEPETFRQNLKLRLGHGIPYPQAYAQAAALEAGIPAELLSQPNNILGLNYVLALKRLCSPIQPLTITRIKAGYHQESITDKQIASATALRKLVSEDSLDRIKPFIPPSTYEILHREKDRGKFPMNWDRFFPFLLQNLFASQTEDLAAIWEMEEGLQHRIKKMITLASSFQELMEQLKTKRYTWNRLQRLLLYVLLHLQKDEMRSLCPMKGVPYIRVLGFSPKGRQLLHEARTKSAVPILARIPRDIHPMLNLDIRASSIYALGHSSSPSGRIWRSEYANRPIQSEQKGREG